MTTSSNDAKILLVEDTPTLARTYMAFLKEEPYQIDHVDSGEAALQTAAQTQPDVITMDLRLPGISGIETLRKLREQGCEAPTITLTAHGPVTVAVEAMQAGAVDFLLKPFRAERLKVTLTNALKNGQLTAQIKAYEQAKHKGEFQGIIGQSLEMQAAYRSLESAAASKATVFITGESGVGKELCAEATHNLSSRRKRPFIPVNCAAIPRDLMDSEIFGHLKGAFTGAIADRDGAAAAADGAHCSYMKSVRWTPICRPSFCGFFSRARLPAWEQRGRRRLMSASSAPPNRDPWAEVGAGRFREDLLYRLYVLPIEVPPLRERGQDVIRIAEALLTGQAAEEGKARREFSTDARAVLQSYPWPGNIRELQNAVRQSVVMHNEPVITAAMLPARIRTAAGVPPNPTEASGNAELPPEPQSSVDYVPHEAADTVHITPTSPQTPEDICPLADIEQETIEGAIAICGGNITQASKRLGNARATIYRKLKEWRRAARTSAAVVSD